MQELWYIYYSTKSGEDHGLTLIGCLQFWGSSVMHQSVAWVRLLIRFRFARALTN